MVYHIDYGNGVSSGFRKNSNETFEPMKAEQINELGADVLKLYINVSENIFVLSRKDEFMKLSPEIRADKDLVLAFIRNLIKRSWNVKIETMLSDLFLYILPHVPFSVFENDDIMLEILEIACSDNFVCYDGEKFPSFIQIKPEISEKFIKKHINDNRHSVIHTFLTLIRGDNFSEEAINTLIEGAPKFIKREDIKTRLKSNIFRKIIEIYAHSPFLNEDKTIKLYKECILDANYIIDYCPPIIITPKVYGEIISYIGARKKTEKNKTLFYNMISRCYSSLNFSKKDNIKANIKKIIEIANKFGEPKNTDTHRLDSYIFSDIREYTTKNVFDSLTTEQKDFVVHKFFMRRENEKQFIKNYIIKGSI